MPGQSDNARKDFENCETWRKALTLVLESQIRTIATQKEKRVAPLVVIRQGPWSGDRRLP